MQKLIITKIDKETILVECDNIIKQPFHSSSWKEMILFINAHIKKLEHTDIFKAIEEYKGTTPFSIKTRNKGKRVDPIPGQNDLFESEVKRKQAKKV